MQPHESADVDCQGVREEGEADLLKVAGNGRIGQNKNNLER